MPATVGRGTGTCRGMGVGATACGVCGVQQSVCPRRVCVRESVRESVCVRVRIHTLLLALVLLVSVATAEEYDYYGWPPDGHTHSHTHAHGGNGGSPSSSSASSSSSSSSAHGHAGRFYAKQPQCVDIPADLRLCSGVGYKRMRLPTLLEHETLAEVRQQAGSWVPLLAKRCHADTQLFLCSLFAPVCLDRPIYPCRSLCEAVRDACAPVMETYGFPWPHMLTCSKFPVDNDLCIPMQYTTGHVTQTPVSKVCPPCDNELKVDTILEHFCASDFVLKLKLKEVKKERGDRKLIAAQKRKKVLKMGLLRKKELKKLVLYIKHGANCPCPPLEPLGSAYLLMGRRSVDQQLLVTAIHQWDKRSKELKFALKYMKSHQCPSYHTAFQ